MLAKALFLSMALVAPAAASPPPNSFRLVLNLPSYRLELWDGDEQIKTYQVTIGMPGHATPTGGFAVTRIEWNPWWTPPDSKWAAGKARTPPGATNPMGRAKLQFDELLYVHGSSNAKQIGGPHSHGCVRLKNADVLDLARTIALRSGMLSESDIAALERNSKRTRSIELPAPVSLFVRYALTEEIDGELITLDDPYGWGNMDGKHVVHTVPVQAVPATEFRTTTADPGGPTIEPASTTDAAATP